LQTLSQLSTFLEEFDVLFDPNATYYPFNAYSLPSFTIDLACHDPRYKKQFDEAQ